MYWCMILIDCREFKTWYILGYGSMWQSRRSSWLWGQHSLSVGKMCLLTLAFPNCNIPTISYQPPLWTPLPLKCTFWAEMYVHQITLPKTSPLSPKEIFLIQYLKRPSPNEEIVFACLKKPFPSLSEGENLFSREIYTPDPPLKRGQSAIKGGRVDHLSLVM